MLRLVTSAIIIGFASLAIGAQFPVSSTTPDPYEAKRTIRRTKADNGGLERRRLGGQTFSSLDRRVKNPLFYEHFRELYRKPDVSEIDPLQPSVEIRARYREFLKGSESGITVLAPTFDCARSAIVVDASERCLRLDIPGAGSSFSFRYGSYRIARLSDISYTGTGFLTVGDFTHGILTAIGDVPIEQVGEGTGGMAFLRSFDPSRQIDDGANLDEDFIIGVVRDGLSYKRSWAAVAETTYLLRSVAYRGRSIRMFEDMTYDEFEFDKRRDVIVAFRVVDIQPEGNLTMVWKKLADEKSPSIGSLIEREK